MELTIYIPTGHTHIDPGSAVVGQPDRDRVRVDYESDRFGAYKNLAPSGRFYANLDRAAGRHVEQYPTIARAWLPEDTVVAVGVFNTDTKTVHIDQRDLFDQWAAPATADGVDEAAAADRHDRYLHDLSARIQRGDVNAMIEASLLRDSTGRDTQ